MKIKFAEQLAFFNELGSIYNFGFNLADSLEHLHSAFGRQIKPQIKSGQPLSAILQQQGFPAESILLIQAGELNGDLIKPLNLIIENYEQQIILRQRLIKALTYPAMIIVISLLIVLAFILVIIPKFKLVYATLGLTQFNFFNFKPSPWLLTLGTGCGTLLGRQIKIYLEAKNYRKINLFKKYFLAFFCSALGAVLENQAELTAFIERSAQNSIYKAELQALAYYLKKGLPLSEGFLKTAFLNQADFLVLKQAEFVDDLSEVLKKLANKYNQEFFLKIEQLAGFVEPVLITLVGVFIGFLAVSLLSPVFNLSQNLL